MRKVRLFILFLCCIGCLLQADDTWRQTEGARLQPDIAKEVMRFHVRADSDDKVDQNIKLQVKSAVVCYLQPILEQVRNIEQAKQILKMKIPKIREVADAMLKKLNCCYKSEVFLKEEYFPQKTYGDCTFPAGIYDALVVTLGSGEGQNWWCMLYPGLCFVDDTYAIVSEEKKEELEYILPQDAYEWIVEPRNKRISFRLEGLQNVAEYLEERIPCVRKQEKP